MSLKSRREDATVAVITAMTIVIAVTIIAVGVWNVASDHGCDSFLRPVNGWLDAGMLHLALVPLSSAPSVLETGQGMAVTFFAKLKAAKTTGRWGSAPLLPS